MAAKIGTGITDKGGVKEKDGKPFDSMNNIVANLLLNLTRLVSSLYLLINYNNT